MISSVSQSFFVLYIICWITLHKVIFEYDCIILKMRSSTATFSDRGPTISFNIIIITIHSSINIILKLVRSLLVTFADRQTPTVCKNAGLAGSTDYHFVDLIIIFIISINIIISIIMRRSWYALEKKLGTWKDTKLKRIFHMLTTQRWWILHNTVLIEQARSTRSLIYKRYVVMF